MLSDLKLVVVTIRAGAPILWYTLHIVLQFGADVDFALCGYSIRR